MNQQKNNYKFSIAKDSKGNIMLSAFCGEIDPAAVSKARYISPKKFVEVLSRLMKQAGLR